MKIAFIHSALSFYRITLFNTLSKKMNVVFFFHTVFGKVHDPLYFKYKMLRGIPIPYFFNYMFPPALFFCLIDGRFNILIAAGAAQLDTMVAFLVARLLRRPFILWDVEWFYNSSTLSKLRYPFWRLIVLNSDALVLPGTRSKQFHVAVGVPEEKIFLSPNTSKLEPESLGLESLRVSLGFEAQDRIILCFSRISPEKGLEYLVDSYRYIQRERVKILIATTLPANEDYMRALRSRAEAIRGGGIVIKAFEDSWKAQLFHMCDIFALPSVTQPESGPDVWGMTLNEALSAGKPLVASTSVGGAYDMIVQGRNGFMVRERDAQMLGEALQKLLDSPRLKEMGEYSKRLYSAKFKLAHEVQGFNEAIQNSARPHSGK